MGPKAKSLVAVASLLFLSLAGCVTDLSPIYIESFTAPALGEESCGPSEVPISGGTLDTSKGADYVVGVKVKNDLPNNALIDEGRVNSNRLMLNTAELSYRFADGKGRPPEAASQPISGFIDAEGSTGLLVSLLTSDGIKRLDGQTGLLLVSVTIKGKLASGGEIKSSGLEFPINLCQGCVYKRECEDPTTLELKAGFSLHACTPQSIGQPDGYRCVDAPVDDFDKSQDEDEEEDEEDPLN